MKLYLKRAFYGLLKAFIYKKLMIFYVRKLSKIIYLGNTIYTKNELVNLSDEDLLLILKKSFNINPNEPIEIIGELGRIETSIGTIHHRIYNIKLSKDFSSLNYPLIDLEYNITENGIYVPPNFDKILKKQLKENSKLLVICNLELAKKEERIKHDNPFLLCVNSLTIQTYSQIDSKFIIKDENNNIILKTSVINNIKYEYKEQLEQEIQKFENELLVEKSNINQKLELLKEDFLEEEKNFSEKKLFLEETLNLLKLEHDKKNEKIDFLKEQEQKLSNNINDKNIILKNINELIEEKDKELSELEEIMAKKLEKLREFVRVHADRLLELEFIDEEEYNDVLMINRQENLTDEIFLNFKEDFESNRQKAISHIQAYLFNKDVIYPRYIIEDFFALIQTNDLIILAGESGSGKTNLVKSFADAIGGKAFIIPVKPNWTSAEDLLGYYNPLEKKYLATPFLEALLEAQNNPTIPYFICLDEMNLARIEYYFADFLSLLEERKEIPEIKLYSEDESSHTLSELKNVLELIEATKEKYQKKNITNFVKLLQDEEINKELTRVFGFSDKDSLIKYHTDLRRMISGILNIPSSIKFPLNVRIIGAINIDETTHYLSPKILDRAHIMKFDSPLLFDWTQIADEIEENENKNLKIKFTIEELGLRDPYPSFDKDNLFCQIITSFTKSYFQPLGIEVGLRTIRQGLNYQNIYKEQESNENLVLNNFILHKILPKMTFDWKKKVDENRSKEDILLEFQRVLKDNIDENLVNSKSVSVINELDEIITASRSNDGIVNYWA